MDSILRPKAAAKRMKSKMKSASLSKTFSKSASLSMTHERQLPESSPVSLKERLVHHEPQLVGAGVPVALSGSQLQNPYLNQRSLNWAEVQEVDRQIFLLQRGAPLHGSTLPQDWTHPAIKRILREDGIDSHDKLGIRDRTEILKSRYESVRLGLQVFFGSTPEPDNNNDWTVSRTEGFDVYNMIPGSKYWRHYKDSVVGGTKTSSSSYIEGSARDMITNVTENPERDKLLIGLKAQDGEIKRTPTSLQDEDHEDGVEKGMITEAEETLVESMREEYIAASIMSEAALEGLLLHVESYLRNEPDPEATPDLYSSDSRGCESTEPASAEPASAYSVKALGKISFIAPEAKSTDLYTSSDRELEGPIQINKERMTPDPPAGPYGKYNERGTRKTEVKARKRRSRGDFAVTVHQDLPGRTPLIERTVRMNPASPGTDIPKENLGNNGSVEHLDRIEIGMPQTRGQHGVIGLRSDGQRLVSASVFDESFGSSSSRSSRTMT